MNDMVWDGTRARFFVSSGTSVLMVNPETADVEDTLDLGAAANHIAISSDGTYLYATIGAIVQRYRVRDHGLDLTIALGTAPAALIAIPGQPGSILVSYQWTGQNAVVYDDRTPRAGTLAASLSSLYVRPSDKAIFGYGNPAIYGSGWIYELAVAANGVTATRSWPTPFRSTPIWSGNFASDVSGNFSDLGQGVQVGALGFAQGLTGAYPSIADPSGQTAVCVQRTSSTFTLMQYSLRTFRPIASAALTQEQATEMGVGDPNALARSWGDDGVAIGVPGSGSGGYAVFFHLVGLSEIPRIDTPAPTLDALGITHIPLAAQGLAFDAARNLLWATIPGSVAQYGNSVVSIDPVSGRLVDWMDVGSGPGQAIVSGDGSRLFVALGGAPVVASFDLATKQAQAQIRVNQTTDVELQYTVAGSLAALPNEGNSFAMLTSADWRRYTSTVAIYDGGLPRPQSYTGVVDSIFPGDAANSLYAAEGGMMYGDGTHAAYRLLFDSRGVTLGQTLTPLALTFHPMLVYAGGQLFTSGVQAWTPDTSYLNGSFGASGIPIPLVDQNLLTVVPLGTPGASLNITTFDLTTMRPLASLTLPNENVAAAVRIGPRSIAVATTTEVLLVPLSTLLPWPAPAVQMQTVAKGVQSITIGAGETGANAIAALPGTSKLLLAMPGSAGSMGNSIAVLNTGTGQIESSGYIGSEPTIMQADAKGTSVYAYLSGELRIGRLNVASATRDLVFAADPAGGTKRYSVVDMALGPDGGLTTSLPSGWLATFDNGVVRPKVDNNTVGPTSYGGAPYKIGLSADGTKVYAFDYYWSFQDFKRDALAPDGLSWLSGTSGLPLGEFKSAQGLLYSSNGLVFNPETTRTVGRFQMDWGNAQHVAPDPAAGRVYFIAGSTLLIYDSHSYAKLAQWLIPGISYQFSAQDLVRYGTDGLAIRGGDGKLYLVKISAIPLLAQPVASPQPALPVTPGVTVVDLAANDLAYDPSRDVLYATTPNSEAANGDRIVAIAPASGTIQRDWKTATNPNLLALSDDQRQLFFSAGSMGFLFYSGYSPYSESIVGLDLTSGTMGQSFPTAGNSAELFSYQFLALTAMPGQPGSVAAIQTETESIPASNGGYLVAGAPGSLHVYDNGKSRPNYLLPHTFSCNFLTAAATASRLYCSAGGALSLLSVNDQGVKASGSFRLLPGWGAFGPMAFWNGRIYTTTGLVVDPEGRRTIARLVTQGPVATDGRLVYWVDPSTSSTTAGSQPSVTLRSFDTSTLQAVRTKQVLVTQTDVSRLVMCGHGRVAFRAGKEIYIVNP